MMSTVNEWFDSIATRRHIIHLHEDYRTFLEPFCRYRMKALGNFLDEIYSILTDLYPASSTDQLIHVWVRHGGTAHYQPGLLHDIWLRRLTGRGTEATHEVVHLSLARAGVPNDIVGTDLITGSRHHDLMYNGLMRRVQSRYVTKAGLLKGLFWFEGIYLR